MNSTLERDLKEYQRLQSIKYYKQKLEKPRPVTQFILGRANQPDVLHKGLEPYITLATQRWLQHRNQILTGNQPQARHYNSSKLLSERNKLGRVGLEEQITVTATNNWLCQLPLTITQTVLQSGPLYREMASTKYDNYLQALESTSNQLKKRFRSEYCRNVVHTQIPIGNDSSPQVLQTIPQEYVELATWRYQQSVKRHSLVSSENKETNQHSKLFTYSGGRLGGGHVPLFLGGDYFNMDTIEDYRHSAAYYYWLRTNIPSLTNQSVTCGNISPEEEQLSIYAEYSKKPDSLYRNEAHKRYELYLQTTTIYFCRNQQYYSKDPILPFPIISIMRV
ncbi:hypothetical protein Gasu2_41210 [Galdieria sulphuraria]|nr:hypothetical protein Gasu2_41210 [Galdieria sulphuraria]